jgi:hypothetical protein
MFTSSSQSYSSHMELVMFSKYYKFHEDYRVKAHYGGQKMYSQILFFKTMQLSTSTKPILKEVFINYTQNKVVQ